MKSEKIVEFCSAASLRKNSTVLFFFILFCAAVFVSPVLAQRAQVKNVAVIETQIDEHSGAASELSKAEVRIITNEIRREAINNLPRGRFNVMTSETVMSMGDAVLEECAEENCVIALGSKIGADYIVRGILSKFRNNFTLTIEMYETEYGMLVATADPVRTAEIDGLLEKTTAVCARMYKKFVETSVAPNVAVAPSAAPVPAPAPAAPAPVSYTVAVSAMPANGGSVTRTPNQTGYVSGTYVAIKANAAAGYRFTGWSGAPAGSDSTKAEITVRVSGDAALIANFVRTYTLAVNTKPSNGGRVQISPNQTRYDAGTTVSLTAIPNSGYKFNRWTQGTYPVSNDSLLINKIDRDLTLTANFSIPRNVYETTSMDAVITETGDEKKASGFKVTMRYGGAALGAGGLIGGLVYHAKADSEYERYDKAAYFTSERRRAREKTEDFARYGNVFYALCYVGLGAFTLSLFF